VALVSGAEKERASALERRGSGTWGGAKQPSAELASRRDGRLTIRPRTPALIWTLYKKIFEEKHPLAALRETPRFRHVISRSFPQSERPHTAPRSLGTKIARNGRPCRQANGRSKRPCELTRYDANQGQVRTYACRRSNHAVIVPLVAPPSQIPCQSVIGHWTSANRLKKLEPGNIVGLSTSVGRTCAAGMGRTQCASYCCRWPRALSLTRRFC
jgi:hypothetical protein